MLLSPEKHLGQWQIEKIIHFEPGVVVKDGFSHFGFHDKSGRLYAIMHQKHFLGPVGEDDNLEWTLAPDTVFEGVPNIQAAISFPMYVDSMSDGILIVSCFGNNRLYRVDPKRMEARLFVDGESLGMKHAGNCVVDDRDHVWVNEVEGCKIWRFDATGRPVLTLGDGTPGFQRDTVGFDTARFNWIYDIRPGPDGNIYVLDSKNFAVRMIDVANGCVMTLAGTGTGGYRGDGEKAISASFGSDPKARFDGPISLSLDEQGDIFIGDRHNHVVRRIDRRTGVIETIAGMHDVDTEEKNDPVETDPRRLRLPKISSMDYYAGRLFVPTDLVENTGDLIVLRKENNHPLLSL